MGNLLYFTEKIIAYHL